MHSLASVVVRAGLLSEETLAQFRKWGLPVPEEGPELAFTTPQDVVAALEEVMQDEEMVRTRETDLQALQLFLATQQMGTLHLAVPYEGLDDQMTDIPCVFGRTQLGELLIPHRGLTISDILVNGHSYLVDHDKHIFFSDVRDLFFGKHAAFLVCTPSRVEEVPC